MKKTIDVDGMKFEIDVVQHEQEEWHEDECGRSNMLYTVKRWEGTIRVLTPFGQISCSYDLRGEADGPEGSVNWECLVEEAGELIKGLQGNSPIGFDGAECVEDRLEDFPDEVGELLRKAAEPATDAEVAEAVEMFESASARLNGRRVEGRVGGSLAQELWNSGRFLRQESLSKHAKVIEAHAQAVRRTREQAKELLASLQPQDRARKALETLAKSVRPLVASVPKQEFLERMGRAWDEMQA